MNIGVDWSEFLASCIKGKVDYFIHLWHNVVEPPFAALVCCSVLQCVAVCCNELQCVAVRSFARLPHTATR